MQIPARLSRSSSRSFSTSALECRSPRKAVWCRLRCFLLINPLRHVLLVCLDLHLLVLDVQTQPVVDAHVLIGHPDQCKEGKNVATPIRQQHFEPGDDQEARSYVMAEAIFTGEEIEKFPA